MGRRAREKAARRGGGNSEKQLARLVEELGSDPAYALGGKRFPRRVSVDEAVAVAEALHAELDAGVALRGELADAQSMPIACDRGCNACCEEMVLVFLPEAAVIARWLARPENAAARARFVARHAEWRAAVGDAPERLADAAARDDDRARYEALHRAEWRKRVLCAFNDGGECLVYPVRPLLCRNAHAVGTADRCAGGSFVPATRLTFAPVDRLMGTSTYLLRATHNAASEREGRGEPVCSYVERLLSA